MMRALLLSLFLATVSAAGAAAGTKPSPCPPCPAGLGMPKPMSPAELRRATLKQFKLTKLPSCEGLNDLPEGQGAALRPFIRGCHERIRCSDKSGLAHDFVVNELGPSGGRACPERDCVAPDCACREVRGTNGATYSLRWTSNPAKRACFSRFEVNPAPKTQLDRTATYRALDASVTHTTTGDPCTACPDCVPPGEFLHLSTDVECQPPQRGHASR